MESSPSPESQAVSPLDLAIGSYRLFVKGMSWWVSLWDQIAISQSSFAALPPIALRFRVGSVDLNDFLTTGQRCMSDIETALQQVGKQLSDFSSILDFGCGCGRTLLWLVERAREAQLFGADIDSEAIAWCRAHLQSVHYTVNEPLPPLAFPDAQFDLIYALSVFTHIDASYQHRWLSELQRLTKPKGMVLITVLGPDRIHELPAALQAEVKENGLLFMPFRLQRGIFPEWYQLTYHTQAYVIDTFAQYFKILAYIPQGANRYQDLIVLERMS